MDPFTAKTSPRRAFRRRGKSPATGLFFLSLLLLLTASSSTAEASATFLNRYTPSTDVAAFASLDLDRRSVVARLALGGDEGLEMARDVYENGMTIEVDSVEVAVVNGTGTTIEDVVEPTVPPAETLQSLGANVENAVGNDSSATFQTFKRYYGKGDYADRWIQAGFDGAETEFTDGNADFRNFGSEGRAAAIRYGTAALSIWINVVGRLEAASILCFTLPGATAVLADWDRAVALYIGGSAKTATTPDHTIASDGHSLYAMAQVEGVKFGTCRKGEISPANDKILTAFADGKAHLENKECAEASRKAYDIKSLMTVTLIQGALGAMYAMDVNNDFQETNQGRGAAYAAALLPMLNECSKGNAVIVRDDLSPGKALTGSFEVVKGALERSYVCLEIECADVGGIVNLKGTWYSEGAEACGNVRPVRGDERYDDDDDDDFDGKEKTDDRFEYEDYSYPIEPSFPSFPDYDPDARSGTGDGHTGEAMDPTNAAILAGIVFGIFGFVGGSAIAFACKRSREQKKNNPETVEFVTSSSNGNGEVDENEVI